MIAALIQFFLVNAAIRRKHPKTCFSGLDYSEVSYRVSARWSCETYCPDPAYPRANSLADPDSAPDFVYPPLIHHIRSSSSLTTLLQLIIDETSLPKKYVSELISFGAVYLSVPCNGRILSAPKRRIPSALSTENEKLQISTKGEIREKAPNQADLMTRASRVLNEDIAVPFGSYCRVHVNPRRHRSAIDGVNWKQRLA